MFCHYFYLLSKLSCKIFSYIYGTIVKHMNICNIISGIYLELACICWYVLYMGDLGCLCAGTFTYVGYIETVYGMLAAYGVVVLVAD